MRLGFTLLELALVLAIVAAVAAAVTLGARAPLGSIGMREAVRTVTAFDGLTRTFAREHDRPLRLVLDLAAGRLRRTGVEGREQLGAPARLRSGCRIEEVRLPGHRVGSGTVGLSVSAWGFSPTYALRLAGPGGRGRWVLVAGLSGQITETDDVRTVEAALAAGETGRHPR